MAHVSRMVRYGQARRKGRMLVPKLDYLQYVVVRSFLSSLAAQSRKFWQAIETRITPTRKGTEASPCFATRKSELSSALALLSHISD